MFLPPKKGGEYPVAPLKATLMAHGTIFSTASFLIPILPSRLHRANATKRLIFTCIVTVTTRLQQRTTS